MATSTSRTRKTKTTSAAGGAVVAAKRPRAAGVKARAAGAKAPSCGEGAPRRSGRPQAAGEGARRDGRAGRAPSAARGAGRALVIVESPTKSRTLSKFLGRGFTVLASNGHVMDLPKRELGVDVENGLRAHLRAAAVARRRRSRGSAPRRSIADRIYLAPDPDREGEAIAWHLAEALTVRGSPGRAAHVQRDHRARREAGARASARDRPEPGQRAAGAARARPPGGLQGEPVAVEARSTSA